MGRWADDSLVPQPTFSTQMGTLSGQIIARRRVKLRDGSRKAILQQRLF